MSRPKVQKHKKKKKSSSCPHITHSHPSISWSLIDLRAKDKSQCQSCSKPAEDIWMCTVCLFCYGFHGDDHLDHSKRHATQSSHQLAVNVTHKRFWCFSCKSEVYVGSNNPDFKIPMVGLLPIDWDSLTGAAMLDGPAKGLVGLRNLGNTCYMNSALQCLSNCRAMTSYFLCLVDYDILCANKPKVALAYRKLMHDMWDEPGVRLVVPTDLLRAIQSVNHSFSGYQQQDTQELLRCLIDQLHEELKHVLTYDPPYHLSAETDDSKHKTTKYGSVISDLFNGLIKSSVQCLHCNKVSVTTEAFQDLSLPIPSGDQLQRLHTKPVEAAPPGVSREDRGYLSWLMSPLTSMWGLLSSWTHMGDPVTLEDCLSAFFSSDELTGDNMYSCDSCKKLRNGVKKVNIVSLPEVMCIHLKRFRHDLMHSSKISADVSFPVSQLDVAPYMNTGILKDDGSSLYNLTGVICHHGSVSGGHYTSYALHPALHRWYEYDDSYVSEVSEETVKRCQVYVLFYTRDGSGASDNRAQFMSQIRLVQEPSYLQFYVSKHWLYKFFTCSDPGPISNGTDYLCVHRAVRPSEFDNIDKKMVALSDSSWRFLHSRFGGGPTVNHLGKCQQCQAVLDEMEEKRTRESQTFRRKDAKPSNRLYAINMNWFRKWQAFVQGQTDTPPGPIDNNAIVAGGKTGGARRGVRSEYHRCRASSDYGNLNGSLWRFLSGIYSGGPVVLSNNGRYEESDDSDDEDESNTEIAQPSSPTSGRSVEDLTDTDHTSHAPLPQTMHGSRITTSSDVHTSQSESSIPAVHANRSSAKVALSKSEETVPDH